MLVLVPLITFKSSRTVAVAAISPFFYYNSTFELLSPVKRNLVCTVAVLLLQRVSLGNFESHKRRHKHVPTKRRRLLLLLLPTERRRRGLYLYPTHISFQFNIATVWNDVKRRRLQCDLCLPKDTVVIKMKERRKKKKKKKGRCPAQCSAVQRRSCLRTGAAVYTRHLFGFALPRRQEIKTPAFPFPFKKKRGRRGRKKKREAMYF